MPLITIIFGLLLSVMAVVITTLAFIDSGSMKSLTSLIPAGIGLPLIVLGVWVIKQPSRRKLLMHIAVVLGLLGALIPFARLIPSVIKWITAGDAPNMLALTGLIGMVILCASYVILCVRSFINARKSSKELKK